MELLTHLNGVDLSFDAFPETERTKHVHRFHPYLGKFIPQLVEAFLKEFFNINDILIDPFMGSGTTLVESHVLGINAVGIDVSMFNCLLVNAKTRKYDVDLIEKEVMDILASLKSFSNWFTSRESGQQFLFQSQYDIMVSNNDYLNKWFAHQTLQELLYYRDRIEQYENQDILKIILSRSARSARLVKHYDLDVISKEPVTEPYDCKKHSRICVPANEAYRFIEKYSIDTIERVKAFALLRTESWTQILHGDSKIIDLPEKECDGIFTSPPYVGLINYHEQHRYAYELFGIENNADKEIGKMADGRSKNAKEKYKQDMIAVFQNMNRFLKKNAKIFIVVGDPDGMYEDIINTCGYKIETVYNRVVSNRTGLRDSDFNELIYFCRKP